MLKLSTKVRYATRIMVYLASREGQGNVRKQDVSEAEDISQDYSEQIFIKLKTGGLVHSHRGSKGGFTLARKAQKISVADVLCAIEGPVNLAPCDTDNCSKQINCSTHLLWQKADNILNNLFSSTTIKDLADQALSNSALLFNI